MWQWNSHAPWLSATNLTAVPPGVQRHGVLHHRVPQVELEPGLSPPWREPALAVREHPEVVPVEVPRLRLTPVVERHRVLLHHVHDRLPRQPDSRYAALATVPPVAAEAMS